MARSAHAATVEPADPRSAAPSATFGQRIAAWFVGGDQLGLFILAAAGMWLLAPETIVRAYDAVARLMDPTRPRPDLTVWPLVPRGLPFCVAGALLTFRLDRTLRIAALVALVLPIAWLRGVISADSVVQLAAFALAAYAIIRLPMRRLRAAILMTIFLVASLVAAVLWWGETPLVGVLGSFPALLPVLWYSVYEHGRRAVLSLRRFLLYTTPRLFSSPVMTYDDVFATVHGAELTAVRWAGVRTIYISLVASIAAFLAARVSASVPRETMTGVPLLLLSYVEYVDYYCGIVVRFNVVIGVLRLFGVPVRNNFRYWLLARTPNEHWQRWNILAREWFVTFIFYPIMRSRRWLFAAVMAAMTCAFMLHLVPLAITEGVAGPYVAASALYWTTNGLAIYVVIKLPKLYPRLMDRSGIPNSHIWSVVGVVLTSAFYAILHGIRTWSGSWEEMAGYVMRLVGQ